MRIKNIAVIDIRKDQPSEDDLFLIDTNVFLWLTYSRLSLLEHKYKQYQLDSYPLYLEKALECGSHLRYSRLSFGEISHVIERCEHEIYCIDNASDIYLKKFRATLPNERSNVVREIKNSFEFIKDISNGINENLDESIIESLEKDLDDSHLDGTDSFLINFAKRNGINKVISDDGDFSTIEDIYLYTSNLRVINEAKRQGKLLVR